MRSQPYWRQSPGYVRPRLVSNTSYVEGSCFYPVVVSIACFGSTGTQLRTLKRWHVCIAKARPSLFIYTVSSHQGLSRKVRQPLQARRVGRPWNPSPNFVLLFNCQSHLPATNPKGEPGDSHCRCQAVIYFGPINRIY